MLLFSTCTKLACMHELTYMYQKSRSLAGLHFCGGGVRGRGGVQLFASNVSKDMQGHTFLTKGQGWEEGGGGGGVCKT